MLLSVDPGQHSGWALWERGEGLIVTRQTLIEYRRVRRLIDAMDDDTLSPEPSADELEAEIGEGEPF